MSSGKPRESLNLVIVKDLDGDVNDGAAVPLREVHTPSSPTYQYYRTIFDRADTDGDNQITIGELQTMIRNNSLTEDDEPLPPHILQRIYSVSDENRDGRLDFNEFVQMLNNPKLTSLFGRFINGYINTIIPRKTGDRVDLSSELYEDHYTCWPPKIGMILISIVELVLFLVDEFQDNAVRQAAGGPVSRFLVYDPTRRWECWRYVTYMFVHIGVLHLTVNLMVQIFMGIPLEMVHGWWRVLAIYFSGVLAGSLGTSITDPTTKLAGASGGVYSLLTAHIATIIMNWKEMSFPLVQLLIFGTITVIDVGTSIYNRYAGNVHEPIGYVAHFAGAMAGLLVGIVVLRNLNITKKENFIWWLAFFVYVILMLVMICWNVFYTDFFPKSWN